MSQLTENDELFMETDWLHCGLEDLLFALTCILHSTRSENYFTPL